MCRSYLQSFLTQMYRFCPVCVCLIIVLIASMLWSAQAAPQVPPRHAQTGRHPLTLYGHIDELSYLCSSAGVKLSSGHLPARVVKIALGSSASYSGLAEGDRVLDIRTEPSLLTLTIERAGKQYQAAIATDVYGLKAAFEKRNIPNVFGNTAFDQELSALGRCHTVILLDRCQSMADNHAGCPGDISKWIWCKQQLDNLYLSTERLLENGFDLVLFNQTYQVRTNVTLWDLRQVFGDIKPAGMRKDIATPLQAVINEYFRTRKAHPGPCIVLVLTDGAENMGQPLQEVLIEASRKMIGPGEVMVTFLQVGESISAEELFDDLDRNLIAKGARYHMVTYKPFAELRNHGLLRELLATVHQSTLEMRSR